MSEFDLPEPSEEKNVGNQDFGLPEGLEPNANEVASTNKSKKWIWIVAIVLLVIICCCCVVGVAMLTSENLDFNNLIEEYSALAPVVSMLI